MKTYTLTRIELRDIDTSSYEDPLLDHKYFTLTQDDIKIINEKIQEWRDEWYEEDDPDCMTDYIWNKLKELGYEENKEAVEELAYEI